MLAAAAAAAAPSFDCKRAKSLVEQQICGVPELGDADRAIAALYARTLATLGKDDAQALREDERTWLKQREQCEDLIRGNPPVVTDVLACIRRLQDERKARLEAILARRPSFK